MTQMTQLRTVLLCFASALLLTACGGDSSSTTATSTPPAATGAAPAITAQPESTLSAAGYKAQFEVQATGQSPVQYQWYNNGIVINGATQSIYNTPVLPVRFNTTMQSWTISQRVTA